MFEGLAYRLEQEITKLAPAGAKIRVIAPSNRFLAVWMGASTFASLSTFSDSCVTAEDYQEHGAAVIHSKCS
jgi:actin-related protein